MGNRKSATLAPERIHLNRWHHEQELEGLAHAVEGSSAGHHEHETDAAKQPATSQVRGRARPASRNDGDGQGHQAA
jgi:hypothetical protein